MDIIPYKIKLLLPAIDSFSKLSKKDVIYVEPKNSISSSSKSSLIRLNELNDLDKTINWEVVEIKNTGFELILVDKNKLEKNVIPCRYKDYHQLVQIIHPELANYPNPIITSMNIWQLLRSIMSSGYISENKIHGSFYYSNKFNLTIEDVENNEDIKRAKEAGRLLATTPKTSKWIPGNIYLCANGTEVLYLGTINRPFLVRNYYTKHLVDGMVSAISYRYRINKNSEPFHLYIELPNHLKDVILSYKDYTISEFLSALIKGGNYYYLQNKIKIHSYGIAINSLLKDDTSTVDIFQHISTLLSQVSRSSIYTSFIDPKIAIQNKYIRQEFANNIKEVTQDSAISIDNIIATIKASTSISSVRMRQVKNIYDYLDNEEEFKKLA